MFVTVKKKCVISDEIIKKTSEITHFSAVITLIFSVLKMKESVLTANTEKQYVMMLGNNIFPIRIRKDLCRLSLFRELLNILKLVGIVTADNRTLPQIYNFNILEFCFIKNKIFVRYFLVYKIGRAHV